MTINILILTAPRKNYLMRYGFVRPWMLLTAILLVPFSVPAQHSQPDRLPHYVINAGGGLVSAGHQTVTYSIGNAMGLQVIPRPEVSVDITIYPNPVRGILHVSTPADIHHAEILNLQGVRISESYLENNTINLSYLASGPYVLLLYRSDGALAATRQILKN